MNERFTDLEQRIGQLTVSIHDMEKRRFDLECELNRLRHPAPVSVPVVKTWIKVPQNAPCWRCHRPTEWRNVNNAPEHLNSVCPGGARFEFNRILDSVIGNTFDVNEFLP